MLVPYESFKTHTETPPPTTEAPTTEVPTTQVPTTELPTTQVPTTQVPTTQVPTTEVPTTQVPTTQVPTTQVPTTQVPTTEGLTSGQPTTAASDTTANATIVLLTTAEPTIAMTTEMPTTKMPTTEMPTTEMPTTPQDIVLPTKMYCTLDAVNITSPSMGNDSIVLSNYTAPMEVSCVLLPGEFLFSQPATDGLTVNNVGILGQALTMEGRVGDSGSHIDLPFAGECALDPYACVSGLTVGMFLKLSDDDLRQDGPKFIISSGPDNATGFDIYRESSSIVMRLKNGTHLWTVTINSTLDSNGWVHIGFVWSNQTGLTGLIDGEEVEQVTTLIPYNVLQNIGNLTLGARMVDGLLVDFASGSYDEVIINEQYLPDDENRKLTFMNGIDGDDCRGVNCIHGFCRDAGIGSFQCVCDLGFNETYCESNMNDCAGSPCLNGGTCRDRIGEYECVCEFGYDGATCDIDITPEFNYSNTVPVTPDDLLDENDAVILNKFYELAQRFILLSSDSLEGMDLFVDTTGRGGEGTYMRLTSEDAWCNALPGGDMSLEHGECLSRPDRCADGFAVSFWIMIDDSMDVSSSAVILHAGSVKGKGPFTTVEITANAALVFTVADRTVTVSGTTANNIIIRGHWMNIGLTWSSEFGVAVYINGQTMFLTTRQSGRPQNLYSPRMTFGTVYQPKMMTAWPIAISDFVIWNRYLYPFELNRFLGVTAAEISYLRDAAFYWTTDSFIMRDMDSLSLYSTQVANTSKLVLAAGAQIKLMEGRDSKGEAFHVNGSADLWVLLGDLPDTCISNPFLCQSGVTLAIWVKLYPVHDNVGHYIVSTGEQSTRGISMYMRAGVLGAALTDGDRKWITEINFISNPDKWIHIAVSWKKDTGMLLYKDGIIVSYDPVGLRKIREFDIDNKVIVGRRNDFLDAYSSLDFEELIFWERFVETWQAREVFSLTEWEQYDDTLYYWSAKLMISSTFNILLHHALEPGEYIGPSANVRLHENPWVVDLTHPSASINLGSFSSDCFTTPLDCVEGLSVSMWIMISHGSADDPVAYLFSAGRGQGNGTAIYKDGHDLVFLVEGNHNTWMTKTAIQVLPDAEWSNIAYTWSPHLGIVVYIDGKQQNHINVTSVHSSLNGSPNGYATIGRPNDAQSDYGTFRIYNLAIWDKYIYPRKAYNMAALTAKQVECIHIIDYCWPFESLLRLRYPYTTSPTGLTYTFDRSYAGRSIYTDGRSGWVSLGDFANKCPKRLAMCTNGFTLTMWLKLEDDHRNIGTLLSLGAEQEEEQGISLIKDETGLEVTVADGRLLWKARIYNGNFTYGPWMFFAMTWSTNAGVSLFIDGTDLTHNIDNRTELIRPGRSYTELILGRGSMDDQHIRAHFDDVELIFPADNEQLPDAEVLSGLEALIAYASADEYYDLVNSDEVELTDSSIITDRNDDPSSAVDTGVTNTSTLLGYIDLGRYSRTCVSDPSRCTPSGVTISTWVKINSVSHFSDNATNPGGLGYFLSSGAQANYGRGFSLTFDGHNVTATMQHTTYMMTFDMMFVAPASWFNLALSWSENQGLRVYIDGVLSGKNAIIF